MRPRPTRRPHFDVLVEWYLQFELAMPGTNPRRAPKPNHAHTHGNHVNEGSAGASWPRRRRHGPCWLRDTWPRPREHDDGGKQRERARLRLTPSHLRPRLVRLLGYGYSYLSCCASHSRGGPTWARVIRNYTLEWIIHLAILQPRQQGLVSLDLLVPVINPSRKLATILNPPGSEMSCTRLQGNPLNFLQALRTGAPARTREQGDSGSALAWPQT